MVPISFPKQKFHHLSPEQLIIIIAVMDCLICFSLNIFANFSYANFIHMPWSFQENFAEGLFLSLRFLVLMYFLGGYAPNRLSDPAFQSKVVSQAWLATFFLLVSVAFIAKTSDRLSRGVTIVLFGSGLIAMLSFHYIFSQYLRKYFNTGRFNIHRAILLCFGTKSKNITEYSGNYSGVCIVEKFHNPSSNCAEDIKKDLISFFTEFRHQITPFNVDFIILDMDWKFCAALEDLRQNYLPLPVPVLLWPDEEVIDIVSKPKMVFGHGQFLEIARAPLKRSEILSKRIFDIIIACIAILVLSPVMIIAAVAIVIDSGFPIVFFTKTERPRWSAI